MLDREVRSGGFVVVGVDGSEGSREALRWADRQARLTGATLRLVHSWVFPPNYGVVASYPTGFNPEVESKRMLEHTVVEVLGEDRLATVELSVVEGHAAPALTRAADGAEVLVVGHRGHGGFSGMLLGSVSRHCVAHASCPVVVVPRHRVAGTE